MSDRQSEIVAKIKQMQWDNVQNARNSCSTATGEAFACFVGIHKGFLKVLDLLCPNPHEGAPEVIDLINAIEDRSAPIRQKMIG